MSLSHQNLNTTTTTTTTREENLKTPISTFLLTKTSSMSFSHQNLNTTTTTTTTTAQATSQELEHNKL
jgi:hypothetical protein